jgi:hypothetical protein
MFINWLAWRFNHSQSSAKYLKNIQFKKIAAPGVVFH